MINLINKENYPEVFKELFSLANADIWTDCNILVEYRANKDVEIIVALYTNADKQFHGYWKANVNYCKILENYETENITEFKRVIKQSREVTKTEIFYTEV